MPAEHYRPYPGMFLGGLSQGYYCGICGGVTSMMGHDRCSPNEQLVAELKDLNSEEASQMRKELGEE